MKKIFLLVGLIISQVLYFHYYSFAQTELNPGDLVIVGLSASTSSCGGAIGQDEISFFCFKDITTSTEIDITDNGWERTTPGFWGDTEGFLRVTRTGGMIPAGTTITFQLDTPGYACIMPDADWMFTLIDGSSVNMNWGGDQLYFMQGGTWSDPVGAHNASYVGGTVLFGFNTKTTWISLDSSTTQSGLYPGMSCFKMEPSGGITNFIKYNAPLTGTDQKDWIIRIGNATNWTSYASCAAYDAAAPNYASGYVFDITSFFNVEAGTDSTVCEFAPIVNLGGEPLGGVWSDSVAPLVGDQFDPSVYGAGNHTVTFTFDDAGCLYTDTKVISVIGNADPSWTNPDTLCPLVGVVNLNSFVNGTVGGVWSGIGVSGSNFDPSAVGAGPAAISYEVSNETCLLQEQHIITVIVDPDATWASPDSICEASTPVNLNSFVTGDSGGSWSGSTGIADSIFDPLGLSGSQSITYQVGSAPCIVTSNQNIAVNQNPTAAIQPNPGFVCRYLSLPIAGNAIDGTGTIYSYSWSGDSSALSVTDFDNTIFSSSIDGTYRLVYSLLDDKGCTAIDSIDVTVLSLPEITLTDSSNVSCFGESDAFIDVSTVSGTPYTSSPAYIYNWDSGSTNEDVSGIIAGNYSMIVADSMNCTDTFSITITEPLELTTLCGGLDATCTGNNDGMVYITAAGGTLGYAYQWYDSSTVDSIVSVISGWYAVTVTDSSNCQKIDSFLVAEPLPLSLSGIITDVACFGGNNGNVQISVAGGTPFAVGLPYIYQWSSGDTTDLCDSLTAGMYYLTITDTNNCQLIDSFYVSQPTALVTNFLAINISCAGGNDGSVDLSVSGGVPPYQFLWNLTITSEDISSLEADTFFVEVLDSNFCTRNDTVVLLQPDSLQLAIASSDPKCFGASDGSAVISISGGINPYLVSWNNGDSLVAISFLSEGWYVASVTDAYGCTQKDSVVLNEPDEMVVSFISENVSCNGADDGSVLAIPTGGISPYAFVWNPSDSINSLTSLSPGMYTVTVSDSNACQKIDSLEIVQPDSLLVTVNQMNATCSGSFDGEIDLSVSGGTSPYVFLWNSTETTENLTLLSAGTYTFTISDSNFCGLSDSVVITDFEMMVITSSVIDASCGTSTGIARIDSVSGGGPAPFFGSPYSYLWSQNAETSDSIIGLGVGFYYVTVTSADNCTSIDTVAINNLNGPDIDSITASSVLCYGENSGSATAYGSGGTPFTNGIPYIYVWENSSSLQTINNLSSGVYAVTLTDSLGCSVVNSVIINEPDSIMLAFSTLLPLCSGDANGAIDLTVTGGIAMTSGAPFSYVWSDNQTTEDVIGLITGWYSTTVADSNNCQNSDSIFISEPSPVSYTFLTTATTCYGQNDGELSLIPSGGSGPQYLYEWENGETSSTVTGLVYGFYSFTVSDINNCELSDSLLVNQPLELTIITGHLDASCGDSNGVAWVENIQGGGTPPFTYLWSNEESMDTIYQLSNGSYTVDVSSSEGCSAQSTTIISTSNGPVIDSIGFLSVLCYGENTGRAAVYASGGNPYSIGNPYFFEWNDGSLEQIRDSLAAGNYFITATDSLGCIIVDSLELSNPDSLVQTLTSISVSCYGIFDGEITSSSSGGTSPYSYLWSQSGTSSLISSLSPGWYYLTLSDANSCITVDSALVQQPQPLVVSIVIVDASCYGNSDGSVALTVMGGTPHYASPYYLYSWSAGQTSMGITDLIAADYLVTISDSLGCSIDTGVVVSQFEQMTITSDMTDTRCGIENGGILIQNISGGGTPPYQNIWSTGVQNSDSLTGLASNTYSVTITSSEGCTAISSFNIMDSEMPVLDSSNSTAVACNGDNSGTAELFVSGGVPYTSSNPYTIAWSNGSSTQSISNLSGGNYTVTITDSLGCLITDTVKVSEYPVIQASRELILPGCIGSSDGSIILTVTGGFPFSNDSRYVFLWSNQETNSTLAGISAGGYTVTVSDAKGCEIVTDFVLSESEIICFEELEIPNVFTPNGDGQNDTWEILNIEQYNVISIEIFNRWGDRVFNYAGSGKGYGAFDIQWNGMFRKSSLPIGSYLYIVMIKDTEIDYKGIVTILR